jgi:hypothetical protein
VRSIVAATAWRTAANVDSQSGAHLLWLTTHPLPNTHSNELRRDVPPLVLRRLTNAMTSVDSLPRIANAAKGTGPKSPKGKEQSRRNALRHGLTAVP